jgi:hypothetical protein
MRPPLAAVALILAFVAVPATAAPPQAGDERSTFVIREVIHGDPVPLSALTGGLVAEAREGENLGTWREREALRDIQDALEEFIDMARSGDRM